ncbi:MAG: hypothetical protein ACO1N0_06070 [Fluviicola sp.]
MKRKLIALVVGTLGYWGVGFAQLDGIEPKGKLVSVEEKSMGFVMKTENFIDVEDNQLVHYLVVSFDGDISSIYVTEYPLSAIKQLKTAGNIISVDLKDDVGVTRKKFSKDEQNQETVNGHVEFMFDKADVCKNVASALQKNISALESTYEVPTSEKEHSFVYGPKESLQIVEWDGTPFRTRTSGNYQWEYYTFANDDNSSFEFYKASYEIGKTEIIGVEYSTVSYLYVTKIGVNGKTCYVTTNENFGFMMTFYKESTKESDFTTLYLDFETEAEAEQCRQHFQAALDAYMENK